MNKNFIFCLLLLAFGLYHQVHGQNGGRIQFIKISEDNDLISPRGKGTDRFYTNGTRVDVYYTKKSRRRFLSKLLIPLNNESDNIFGIGLNQEIYTIQHSANGYIIWRPPLCWCFVWCSYADIIR